MSSCFSINIFFLLFLLDFKQLIVFYFENSYLAKKAFPVCITYLIIKNIIYTQFVINHYILFYGLFYYFIVQFFTILFFYL